MTRPLLFLSCAAACLPAAPLPQRYFELLDAGARRVQARLDAEPAPMLASIETTPAWKHFGYSILAPSVLYAKQHPANPRYHDPAMLALALRIGDLLASENEKGTFEPRLDSDWDTYTWLEAYKLLDQELEPARRERWRRALLDNIAPFQEGAAERLDFPWFTSPYIGTSPNHYSQWAEMLYLGGRVFDRPEWVKLGSASLHRFLTVEQSPDGFWGEHTHDAPTIGYDHLTLSAVGVYCELSSDPACPPALRRSLDFHSYFTYPDGTPVELVNDRNRYWEVSAWSQFAFSNFPDGRRYAEFLTGFFDPEKLSMDQLGRLAQDALYYHDGPAEPIPQDQPNYVRVLNAGAAMRKTGPWVVGLSGIVETPAPTNQYYVDRQSNLSVFHSRLGRIISGANSKRQPELATFREKIGAETYHLPQSSRLQMDGARDRLSVAFNTFFSDLYVDRPTERDLPFEFVISGKGTPADEAWLTLQLVLRPGEKLETGTTSITLSSDPVNLGPEQIGGVIRHHGWTLKVGPDARLVWPVYPYNPYANAPETTLDHAVAALSFPLRLKSRQGHYVRPDEQRFPFTLSVP